ncbi:hypothetical protein HU200_067800 [Digitaria exilis]|uniref:Uncharacterized protein n=1 Tax=Digitaria exilis TaxID=1010633 RepID=A0A835DRY3_9POAL|nr:hypothetical protein HU200_067800 [Digitaria exilis]
MKAAVVTKSSPVLVTPSESAETTAAPPPPAGGATVALSPLDLIMFPFPMKLLLAFDRPIHNPVATIKAALSRTLAHCYHPVAGRLDGEGGIACTGEGVAFVAASASCDLDEEAMATLQHMDLTVRCPGPFCRDEDPLLLVQVTDFSSGGFTVGVTWNHVLADGKGIAQFLQAVGEVACRRRRSSRLPSSWVAAQKSTVGNDGPRCLVRHDIAPDQGRVRLHGVRGPAMSPDDGDDPAPIAFPCNVRRLVGAAAGYYGNCVIGQVVMATSGLVASSSLAELQGDAAVEARRRGCWYDGLAVVSWLNLGFDVVDIGGGAARVMWHEDCTLVPGCRGGAVNVSALCVKPEHADLGRSNLVKILAAYTVTYFPAEDGAEPGGSTVQCSTAQQHRFGPPLFIPPSLSKLEALPYLEPICCAT